MKLYKFFNKTTNKELNKAYILPGIKSALALRDSWTHCYNLEVIEYEAKEVRRLTVEEVKQLNNKNYKDSVVELLELANSKDMGVFFFDKTTGEIKVKGNWIEFSSLDEAICIVNKY